MKKKIIQRMIPGMFAGVTLGQIICILISAVNGTGEFIICTPEFIEAMGSETAAAALQTLLCGIMGGGFASASVIWEMDNIGLALQTGICFGIYAVILLPIAYFTGWMEHSPAGVLSYIGIFLFSFVMVWAIQYFAWKKKINQLNEAIEK